MPRDLTEYELIEIEKRCRILEARIADKRMHKKGTGLASAAEAVVDDINQLCSWARAIDRSAAHGKCRRYLRGESQPCSKMTRTTTQVSPLPSANQPSPSRTHQGGNSRSI